MAMESGGAGQIQEFLEVLRKRRWQIALPALFVVTLGAVFATIVPKLVKVSTRIELKEARNPDDYILRNPAQAATVREQYNAQHHIINYERVFGIIEDQGALWEEYVKLGPEERAEFIRRVMGNLEVDMQEKPVTGGSTFVDISYKDVRGDRAVAFLEELTRVWVDVVVTRDLNSLKSERDTLQNQVNDTEQSYQEVNQKYFDLCARLGLDPTGPTGPTTAGFQRQQDPFYEGFNALMKEREARNLEKEELLAEIDDLRVRLDEEPEWIEKDVQDSGVSFDAEIAKLELRIDKLKKDLADVTPLHSRYAKIQNEIASLDEQIRRARDMEREGSMRTVLDVNEARGELVSSIATKENELRGTNARLKELGVQLRKYDLELKTRIDLLRDLSTLGAEREFLYEELSQRQQELKNKKSALEILTQAYGNPYEIAEKPSALGAPSEPNPALIVTFAVLLGIALGLGTALAAEYGRNSYRSAHEVASVMGVPVLGAINAIMTTAEIRRRQLSRSLVGVSSLVIIGGLGWLIWAWVYAREKLPTEIVQVIQDIQLKLM